MSSSLVFVGLDGEMTGTEITEGAWLCQIGVAADYYGTFAYDITVPKVAQSLAQPQALAVNGFTPERMSAGTPQQEVDEYLYEFLLRIGGDPEKKVLIPVGWNVGAFDMPFVRRFLPRSYSLFSRRTVDLNALCYSMGGITPYQGGIPTHKGWKRLAKKKAEVILGTSYGDANWHDAEWSRRSFEPNWHDAGYDAAASLVAWRWLRSFLNGSGK